MDKDGNKTGGRQKGTPNKANAKFKAVIGDFLNWYMNGDPESEDPGIRDGLIKEDLLMVKPYERLQIVEKLMQYTVPKMQSVAVEAEVSSKTQKTTERLAALSQPAEQKEKEKGK